jgi:4-hydroxybenzoate polyprenyltransferase
MEGKSEPEASPAAEEIEPQVKGERDLTSFNEYIKAYRIISRYEYWPGVAPGLFLSLMLGLNSLEQLLSPIIFEIIAICILLYFSGFVINSLVDIELDKKYKTFKSKIPEAVELIGVGRVKAILAAQVAMALILGLHISITLSNPWLFALVCLGTFFGLGYSIKPFHFKVKGIWHAVSLGASAFFIPLLFIYMAVADVIDPLGVLLILAVTITHYSLSMANQAADHLEDEREGVLTPTVRLGLVRSLNLSVKMTTVGMVVIIFIIGAIYLNSDVLASYNIGFASNLPISTSILLLPVAVLILSIAYYIPIKGLRDLHRISIEPTPLEQRMEKIDKRINYAIWQASGIIGVTLTLAILFVAGFA